MGSVSKFSLESFDSNVCLNCSVKFLNDDEMETPKIHFLEITDEEHEAVSVWTAFNAVLQIPANKQITEEEGVAFGCCPSCSTLLGHLYELHRQLNTLRNLESVFSKILDEGMDDDKEAELESNVMDTNTDTPESNSEITEDPLRLSPEPEAMVTQDSAENNHVSTTCQAKPVPVPAPIPAEYFANRKSQCLNCCVEIHLISDGSQCPSSTAKPGVGAVMGTGAPVKIQISDILDHILMLPPRNNLTADLKTCVDCARVLLNTYVSFMSFENATKPESHLNFILQQIRAFMVSGFTRNSYGGSYDTIVFPVVASSMVTKASTAGINPTPTSKNLVNSNENSDHFSSSMEVQSQPLSSASLITKPRTAAARIRIRKSRKKLTSEEQAQKEIYSAQMAEYRKNKNLHIFTFDPCPICGVVLQGNVKTKLINHIKRHRVDVSPVLCDICGRPCPSIQFKEIHERTHVSAAERAEKAERRKTEYIPHKPRSSNKPRRCFSAEQREKYYKRRRELQSKVKPITFDPCPHCGLVIKAKNRFALKQHIRLRHNYLSHWKCDICHKPCASVTMKRNHEKTHLSASEREKLREVDPPQTWLCPECGTTLLSLSGLKSHIRKLHGDMDARRIHCKEANCNYFCLNGKSLQRHMQAIHDLTSEAKHRCKICDQGFRLHAQLKEHEMTTCEASSRPFACDQGTCTRRFKLKQALMLHLHSLHPLTPEEARRKLYPNLNCPDWVFKKPAKKKNYKKKKNSKK